MQRRNIDCESWQRDENEIFYKYKGQYNPFWLEY